MKAYAPTGALIVAASEIIPGHAILQDDSFIQNGDGSLSYDYAGETKIMWDEQRPKTENAKRMFICEEGYEWRQDELTLLDGSVEPPEKPELDPSIAPGSDIPTFRNTEMMDWWKMLNDECRKLGMEARRFGEAQKAYRTGKTPAMAAAEFKAVENAT